MDSAIYEICFVLFLACIYFMVNPIRKKEQPVGDLVVELSDPDGPYLFLRLRTSVEDILQKDEVVLKVDKRGILSDSQE